MWTKEETEIYSKNQDEGKKLALKMGGEIAKSIKSQMMVDTGENDFNRKGINPIFTPLMIEPILAALDEPFDTVGQTNFQWVIDLYIGRKIKKIIPLLVEIARRLGEGKHDKNNKADGGGPDDRVWYENLNIENMSLRIETQSMSYYISMWGHEEMPGYWEIDVAEYERGKKRQPSKDKWSKEPGHVLSYKTAITIPGDDEEDDNSERVENAWLNLERIARFLYLINPTCTALDFNLYEFDGSSQIHDGAEKPE